MCDRSIEYEGIETRDAQRTLWSHSHGTVAQCRHKHLVRQPQSAAARLDKNQKASHANPSFVRHQHQKREEARDHALSFCRNAIRFAINASARICPLKSQGSHALPRTMPRKKAPPPKVTSKGKAAEDMGRDQAASTFRGMVACPRPGSPVQTQIVEPGDYPDFAGGYHSMQFPYLQ